MENTGIMCNRQKDSLQLRMLETEIDKTNKLISDQQKALDQATNKSLQASKMDEK